MDLDPDGDSHMHSSSSDEADSDAMFPAENEPPGTAPLTQSTTFQSSMHPEAHQTFPEAVTSTPPQSQDLEEAMDMGTSDDRAVENGADHAASRESGPGRGSSFAKGTETDREPGAAWKNKKAMEDYQRAMAQIEDKDFSLSK